MSVVSGESLATIRPGGDMTRTPKRWITGIWGITVIVILTTGCGRFTTPSHHPRSGVPVPSASSSVLDDGANLYTPGPTLTAAPDDAAAAAAAFARAWARPTLPASDWWASIAPLCEAGLAERLRTTDPTNVPATTITGAPALTGSATTDALTFAVPTDAGVLTVGLIRIPAGWRVASVDFTANVASVHS